MDKVEEEGMEEEGRDRWSSGCAESVGHTAMEEDGEGRRESGEGGAAPAAWGGIVG